MLRAKAPGRPPAPAPLLLLRLRARARQVLPRRLGRLLRRGRRALGRRAPLRLRGRLRCSVLRGPPAGLPPEPSHMPAATGCAERRRQEG